MANYKRFTKKIKSVAVVHRPDSAAALSESKKLSEWFKKKKIQVFSHPDRPISKAVPALSKKDLKTLDLAIVLGGDGTYLAAVRMLNGCGTPILGVNMGSLGFLTQVPRDELYESLEKTLSGKMEMRPRAMLEMKLIAAEDSGTKDATYTALNDIVIERGAISQLMNVAFYVDERLVNEVKADGIIISSATGSTAYNLAAGGPILHPQMRATVVTPICPHSLTNRPIIFPEHQTLKFRINNKKHQSFLTVDGQSRGELWPGDEIHICQSESSHLVLRDPTDNYFDLLRKKLRFGERS